MKQKQKFELDPVITSEGTSPPISHCLVLRWDVPDEEQLAGVFSEALTDSGPCSPPQWSVSGQVVTPGGQAGSSRRPLTFHSSTQLLSKGGAEELLLLAGQ